MNEEDGGSTLSVVQGSDGRAGEEVEESMGQLWSCSERAARVEGSGEG
jgi:hypothetical protein